MQTIRITDERAPGVEVVVRVDRRPAGQPRVESVTFVPVNGGGINPPDLGVFDVAGLLGAAAAVHGASSRREPAVAPAAVAVVAGTVAVAAGAKRPAKKAVKKVTTAKKATKTAPVKAAPAGKTSSGKKATKTAAAKKASTTGGAAAGSGGSDRPYRRRPDDFAAKHEELGGSVQALMAHYGAERHQVNGWRSTARGQGLLPQGDLAAAG